MTDCVYFQTIIKELNPSDNNQGDCCTWNMVECNQGSIVKLDFSNYKGIDKKVAFPQTVQFLTELKEFSISGQQNINEIYSLPTNKLEKVDLSSSGLSSSHFPTWIMDASNLKQLDISNTQITGIPQREIKSKIEACNFSNTPICSSYQSSPYASFIPEICQQSCTKGAVGSFSGSGKKKPINGSSGGTPVWPFILIAIVILGILGALGFIYMRKKNSVKDGYDSPRPILPVSKNNKRGEDEEEDDGEVEVAVVNNSIAPPTPMKEVTPVAAAVSPVTYPPAAAVVKHDENDKKIEEVARNNYTTAYGGNANQNVFNNNRVSGTSVKDIYRQHNASNISVDQDQSFYPHPSIYNTMTTDNDSDGEDTEILNKPIIADLKEEKEKTQGQPALLRRKSSRKANVKAKINNNEEVPPVPEIPSQIEEKVELYVANWDYTPTLSDELALVAGDVIEIKKKFDDGWSTGYNRRTKQSGIVPLCYLKEYED